MTTRERSVVIIGGGINGLVAANYCARAGVRTTLLERKSEVGGAAVNAKVDVDGRTFTYPLGATLLGQMQRFVFEETGLAQRLRCGPSPHPAMYHFAGDPEPAFFHADPQRFRQEIAAKWGEEADGADAFEADEAKVTGFLQRCYRDGRIPTLDDANAAIGPALAGLWITGSVLGLAAHYFPSSPRLALAFTRNAIESGPVPLSEPCSALTVAVTASGSVFNGRWGYVAGGMGRLVEVLAAINRELGVRIITSAKVHEVDPKGPTCLYTQGGMGRSIAADHIIFATDPMTAARLVDDKDVLRSTSEKRYSGTSGKLTLLLRDPVRWKHDSGMPGFDSAMKFVLVNRDLEGMDAASQAAARGAADIIPGSYEFYCEGAGLRMLGDDRGYESVMVFFKHASFGKRGVELPELRDHVTNVIMDRMENPQEPFFSRLLTPKDLADEFYFPRGNIDHMMICAGQTGSERTFCGDPGRPSYRFGPWDTLSYCGAGAFPCGSVTGTPGYMCVSELLRTTFKK